MKVIITSGGTKIPIDNVRHIANMSQGTFGSKIALECLKARHNVIFFKRKNSKSPFNFNINLYKIDPKKDPYEDLAVMRLEYQRYKKSYVEYEYDTFDAYNTGLLSLIDRENPDVVILAAAVSDYGVENFHSGKIKSDDNLTIKLLPLPKIIHSIKKHYPKVNLIGFKLLVDSNEEELIAAARKSISENGCKFVVANDLRDIKNNKHSILLVSNDSVFKYESDKNDSNYLAKMIVNKL
jgi:phosphopantothenate---cysteine ligase (CTP)